MEIRPATSADVMAIGRVADAAFRTTYSGLLHPETIGRFLGTTYSPSIIKRRMVRGDLVVAEEHDVVGFAEGVAEDDAVQIAAIAVDPGSRGRGVARALLSEVMRRHPGVTLRAEVLLGNLDAERLLESFGFVPGEVMPTALFEEDVVERHWWCEPGP